MSDQATATPEFELLPLKDTDHIRGGENPEVTLVEFGDYECPDCAEAYQVIKRIESELRDALRFVFRHFPYARLHPHAEQAAQAAEDAGAQGHFWGMHDTLFQNQNALTFDDLVGYASQLSLDVEQFSEALRSEKYAERVREDFRSGVQSGVFGTPTIFLNGVRHNDAVDYESLSAAIQRHREEQNASAGR